jgi:hypothetical protein
LDICRIGRENRWTCAVSDLNLFYCHFVRFIRQWRTVSVALSVLNKFQDNLKLLRFFSNLYNDQSVYYILISVHLKSLPQSITFNQFHMCSIGFKSGGWPSVATSFAHFTAFWVTGDKFESPICLFALSHLCSIGFRSCDEAGHLVTDAFSHFDVFLVTDMKF